MWKNGKKELDTGEFGGAISALLMSIMLMCSKNKSKSISGLDVLFCLLTERYDKDALKRIEPREKEELYNISRVLKSHITKGYSENNCSDLLESDIDQGAEPGNMFEREIWFEPLAGLIERTDHQTKIASFITDVLRADMFKLPEHYDDVEKMFCVMELIDALERMIDPPEGQVTFTDRMYYLLNRALVIASDAGEEKVTLLHIVYSMLKTQETFANELLKKTGCSYNGVQIKEKFEAYLFGKKPLATRLKFSDEHFAPETKTVLDNSMYQAQIIGKQKAGEREFLIALLQYNNYTTNNFLERTFNCRLNDLEKAAINTTEPETIEPVLPLGICPVLNLSAETENEYIERKELESEIIKLLLRRDCNNVLLWGDSGVGRTSVVRSLAQTFRKGMVPNLKFMPVIYFDLDSVQDEKYEQTVDQLFEYMDNNSERIYVIEGFYKYLLKNYSACYQRLLKNSYKLIITVNTSEMTELEGLFPTLPDFINSLWIPEPSQDETMEIIRSAVPSIELKYDIHIEKNIGLSLYRMANDYLISRRFPKKAIELLVKTAADLSAEREYSGTSDITLKKEHIAKRISDMTELPEKTILGIGNEKDFYSILSNNLVGQEIAVGKVAKRLDLIQTGLVDKNKPAAIFFFAGLSGTGKTELAKQIAQVYSSSRKLITYPMENFQESNSLTGLIGSPPGYTGYEEGGKLIKALNRDPYSVVLLDEVEKAHPSIWDIFLNLFDEGIITDRTGVTAYGNKAFFVMTSNIGQYTIADMMKINATTVEIEEKIKSEISNEYFIDSSGHKSNQRCFRPELLGRILPLGGIVIFNALSLQAMIGIAARKAAEIEKRHTDTFENSKLDIGKDVINMIAQKAFRQNEEAIQLRNAYTGGRNISALLDTYVNDKIAAKIKKAAKSPLVRIVINGEDTELITVENEAEIANLLQERRDELQLDVKDKLAGLIHVDKSVFDSMSDLQLAKLNESLSEISVVVGGDK